MSGSPELETENLSQKDKESAQTTVQEVELQDGGTKAWISIFGGWLVLFSTFGYLYSFGVYQDYYTRIFLSNHSPSKIGWIGSFQLMMPFFIGVASGKVFDAGYFHALEITGSVLFIVSLFMLSLARPQHYVEVFLSQGVGMGLGLGLTFVPAVSLTVHHFHRRKPLATGIVMSGSSLGALIFPIMINNLMESIGFAKTVRASGYIVLGMLVLANLLMRTAYRKTTGHGAPLNIGSFFVDPPYIISCMGGLSSMFGFYFPLVYLQLYAVSHGINITLAFYSIAIVNGSGTFGRLYGGYLAQIYGPLNVLIPCTILTGASIFSIFGVRDSASLVIVSVFYGVFSGAWLSVTVAAIATLARHPDEVGARTGLALALASFGSLGSAPVQGALLQLHDKFDWNKPIIFSGVMMCISAVFYTLARQYLVRERSTNKV